MRPPPAWPVTAPANWSAGSITGIDVNPAGLMSDLHASAEYRANLIKVMAKRAVAEAG